MACRDCMTGSLHSEQPTGKVTTIHGLPTYVSEPDDEAAPKGIIVRHTDGFGWELPNTRAQADRYAKRTGCRVYTPDFLGNHWMAHDLLESMDYIMTPQPTWGATLYKIFPILRAIANVVPFQFYNRQSVVGPRTVKFFRDLRAAEAKDLPLGIAGFCIGGLYTFHLCKDLERVDGKSLIDAGFTAHPSFLTVPKDGQEVKLPLSVIVGDNDMALSADNARKLKEILEESSIKTEMEILPGVKHGFAIRWDTNDEKANKYGQQAEDQAVEWFKKQFNI